MNEHSRPERRADTRHGLSRGPASLPYGLSMARRMAWIVPARAARTAHPPRTGSRGISEIFSTLHTRAAGSPWNSPSNQPRVMRLRARAPRRFQPGILQLTPRITHQADN
jgi:hypothetical protein